MKTKGLLSTLLILTLVFTFSVINSVHAQEGEVKGDVTVNAIVPSKVSADHSTVTQNVKEVLADGVQKAVITITLHDVSDNPLQGIKATPTSNRGAIDTIKERGTGNDITTTDADGIAYFEVSSNVPGEAVLTSLADSLITLDQVTITFLPLPFPKNVTISVEVPKFISPTGEITLLKPSGENTQDGKKIVEKSEKDKIVNLGVNVKIPFWIMTFMLLSVLMNIVLFVLVINLILKTKKTEQKEEEILKKEEEVLEEITKKKEE